MNEAFSNFTPVPIQTLSFHSNMHSEPNSNIQRHSRKTL